MVIVTSDDDRLIDSTLAGDSNAFGSLVLKYQDRLYATLVHMLGSVHDARDVAQDAFLLAYEKLETFRRESSFYSWLFRIAYNAAISHRRKGRRDRSSMDHHAAAPGSELPDVRPTTDPAYQLEAEDSRRQVRDALDSLGPEYRDAIILKELEGLQYDEIAEILNCPIGTVRSRIHRARQLLREKLARVAEREQT